MITTYKCDISHRQGVTEHPYRYIPIMCDVAHMTRKTFPIEAVRRSITRLMDENDDKAKPLAETLGFGETAIRDIFLDKAKSVGGSKLAAIAAHYGVTVEEILMGVATTKGASPVIEGHLVRWVPLIGLASAGAWREAISFSMGEVSVRADKAGRKAFAVEICGDSMDKILPEGGWAVVDPDMTSLYDEKVYLVMNADYDATLKRYRSNPARLEPVSHNPTYETIMIEPGTISVVGRVVAYGNDDGL